MASLSARNLAAAKTNHARPGHERARAEGGGLVAAFWDRPDRMNFCADMIGLLALLALAYGLFAAVKTLPLAPIATIEVTQPLRRVAIGQLERAAREAVGGNFFTLDVNRLRSRFEKVPWVRRVDVRRSWPDTVLLVIEEQEPVARWQNAAGATAAAANETNDDEYTLVNQRGEVFSGGSEPDETTLALPLLSGPPGSSADLLNRYQAFADVLAPLRLSPEVLLLSPRLAWETRLSNGTLIKLGRDELAGEWVTRRLQRYADYFPQAQERLRLGKVAQVDMRYPAGFAIQLGTQNISTTKDRS